MSYKKHTKSGNRSRNTRGRDNLGTRSRNAHVKTFTGTVQGSDKGYAFIIPDDKEQFKEDFFVPRHSVNGAYHGDSVLAAIVKGGDREASVLKILKRGATRITGTAEVLKGNVTVYPDNLRYSPVFVATSLTNGARNGDKVICEITNYPKGKLPGGKIVEILGESGELYCEELAIIRSFELETEFPEDVLAEARKVADEKVILGKRRDLRQRLIFTIDGEDTRDIDDGVSLEIVNGNFVLGVHIADVSHYVKFKSALDKNAYSRGTSVYFPDRVLPMLPKELSNGACSLNEGEDRFALSCEMTFNKNGERLSYEIFKSVIKSRRKTTYTTVQSIIDNDNNACEKYADIVETVLNMKDLCLALERKRDNAGSVNLDVKEAHIYVDGNGEIVIPPCERMLSQRIIEQFMISANEAVAEFLQKNNAPCLFRIHESPAEDKAASFCAFLRDLGINVKEFKGDITSADFQKILKAAEDKPYFSVINKVMLRTMQKARYAEENLGHFGLASSCYCHFTSPIRRYPDLFVHRSLKLALDKNEEKAQKLYGGIAHDAGVDCSARERVADEAERKVDDLYKLAYMSERLGEEFDAVISGVTSHGIYCELENTVEGFVPLEDLPKDRYEFFEDKFLLKGTKHRYKLGDPVKVKVADYDLGRMKVLFAII